MSAPRCPCVSLTLVVAAWRHGMDTHVVYCVDNAAERILALSAQTGKRSNGLRLSDRLRRPFGRRINRPLRIVFTPGRAALHMDLLEAALVRSRRLSNALTGLRLASLVITDRIADRRTVLLLTRLVEALPRVVTTRLITTRRRLTARSRLAATRLSVMARRLLVDLQRLAMTRLVGTARLRPGSTLRLPAPALQRLALTLTTRLVRRSRLNLVRRVGVTRLLTVAATRPPAVTATRLLAVTATRLTVMTREDFEIAGATRK